MIFKTTLLSGCDNGPINCLNNNIDNLSQYPTLLFHLIFVIYELSLKYFKMICSYDI